MTAAIRQFDAPRPKRWARDEFESLVDIGAFDGKRLFLFRGVLIEMSPQSADHAWAVRKTTAVMTQLFSPPIWFVNVQLPFSVPGDSLLEPDLAICLAADLSAAQHATKAGLVIEIAASSLTLDRDKATEYAAAGVPEYWIVNLNERCIEIYRDAVADPTAALGFRYPPPTVAGCNDVIALKNDPNMIVKVIDLLP